MFISLSFAARAKLSHTVRIEVADALAVDGIDEVDELIVAEGSVAPLLVLGIHALLHRHDERIVLAHLVFVGQAVIVVDPEGDARCV